MTYLLDSTVLIDTLNNRNGRPQLLTQFSHQNILLACCAVNVTELYMGIRHGQEAKTEKLIRSLEFYPITSEIAKLAGTLFRHWRTKGKTLGIADVTIAAVAITHDLVLVSDNQKHFPMPDLKQNQLRGAVKIETLFAALLRGPHKPETDRVETADWKIEAAKGGPNVLGAVVPATAAINTV